MHDYFLCIIHQIKNAFHACVPLYCGQGIPHHVGSWPGRPARASYGRLLQGHHPGPWINLEKGLEDLERVTGRPASMRTPTINYDSLILAPDPYICCDQISKQTQHLKAIAQSINHCNIYTQAIYMSRGRILPHP